MEKRFSEQLTRYSQRVVCREKLILLGAPPQIIKQIDSLVEKSKRDLNRVDLKLCELAIEEERVSNIRIIRRLSRKDPGRNNGTAIKR